MNKNSGYFQYSLDDVKKSSERNLFSVVSTFAGGGGSSTGYKLAGGYIKLVNEFQQIAVDTYIKNYPDTKYICDDIRNVTGKQILDSIGMEVGMLDILDGSPPCPPFSMSGSKKEGWNKTKTVYGKKQKNIEDLTFDFINLASDIKPKVIVCENVKGLTMQYAAEHFSKMVRSFEDIGYAVTWKIMKASNYGVPQKRERVFIVCVRLDVLESLGYLRGHLNYLVFPEPFKKQPTQRDSIFELLNDKENIREGEELEEIMRKSTKYDFLVEIEEDPDTYVSLSDAPSNTKGSGFQCRRVGWNHPSNTLSEKGLMTGFSSHLHPIKDRGFTTHEAIKLMSLPDDFQLEGKLNERLARVGLMVAPLQMKYLAETIYKNIINPFNIEEA